MTIPVPKQLWEQYYRMQFETAFGAGGGSADWNIGGNGGGATGWRDLAVVPGSVGITPTEAKIFAEIATGKRAMNQQPPIAGGRETAGTLEMPIILELFYPVLKGFMGSVNNVETAGTAALASTAFASVATLDTQSDGTEMLKFVISSSTAASAAAINIIQSAETVETVTIGTNAGSVDGDYYSKGAYDGTTNAITFTVDGTVTAGDVVISGVDYVTNTFTFADSNAPAKIEAAGQPQSGSNSAFYAGVGFSDLTLSYDRTAADGLLMSTVNFASKFLEADTPGTYGNDAALYYHPVAGWEISITKGGAAFDKATGMELTPAGGTVPFVVSSGSQDADGLSFGSQAMFGTVNILPEDATEWNEFTGLTVGDYHIIMTSPQFIVDAIPWSMTIELTKTYFETYAEAASNDFFGADIGIRTIEDATDGIAKITTVTRMPV